MYWNEILHTLCLDFGQIYLRKEKGRDKEI